MKKIVIIFCLIILLIPKSIYALVENAKAITIMDMDSNRVLYSKNQNEERLIASITNIMTI